MGEWCGHCGRDDTVESVKSVVIDSDATVVTINDREEVPAEWQTLVDVKRCTACGGPTFTTYRWLDPFFDTPEDARDEVTVYPPQHELTDLPARVLTRYEGMLELQAHPDAFAVRAGRLIEAICADQGVTTGQLYRRLTDLAARGDLPKALADQAHLIREYRNLGGHDAELEVQAADVPLIRSFAEALLEFFYWGPAKLGRGAANLQRRRDALNAGTPRSGGAATAGPSS
jgi:hypothetical protein